MTSIQEVTEQSRSRTSENNVFQNLRKFRSVNILLNQDNNYVNSGCENIHGQVQEINIKWLPFSYEQCHDTSVLVKMETKDMKKLSKYTIMQC